MPDTLDDQSPTPEGKLATRLITNEANVNINGNISAGWLVEHMDTAGAHIAKQYANGRVTTVAMSSMAFLKPVTVGTTISFYVKCNEIRRSSIRICVEVWACKGDDIDIKVTEGDFVFVAIDNEGRTRSIAT